MDILSGIFITTACIMVFFLPSIIASTRKHHNFLAILVTNLILGWSGIGWVIALIWACTSVKSSQ